MIELDERKAKILDIIIKNYLETGEPVGSRTISKYSDLKLSSATIRNEMSDLEDLGFIIQPYTSAGRIPSDLGYRFYVDNLMTRKEQEANNSKDIKDFMIERTEKMEQVLRQVVRLLAINTNYATMITSPSYQQNRLKLIQLLQMEADQVLTVIVLEGNVVKSRVITVQRPLDNEILLKLNLLLNAGLTGLSLNQINLGTISKLKEQAGIHCDVVGEVLDAMAAVLQEDEELEVYTSGTTNIFKYPELSDSKKASGLIMALEEKKQLLSLVSQTISEKDEDGMAEEIQVYIGSESPIHTMRDCSIVTASYELGKGLHVIIGIIGPKRMDYENVMDNLKTLRVQLDKIFRPPEKG